MHWKKKWKVWRRRGLQYTTETIYDFFSLISVGMNWAIPFLSISGAGIALYDIGVNPFYHIQNALWLIFHWHIIGLAVLIPLRTIQLFLFKDKKRQIFINILLSIFLIYITLSGSLYIVTSNSPSETLLVAKGIQYGLLFFLAAYEISKLIGLIYRKGVSSASIFVSSFLVLIFSGTGLLLLPRSSIDGIEITDAIFMSTSAVCVTGLATISLTDFTFLGQIIILVLIQIGGLGVMTFAGLLSNSLAGQSSFQSQLALKDMISSNQISNVLQNVNTIIGVSFLFEIAGMFLIYTTANPVHFDSQSERVYFSIFHAISAFCNAGFSTLPDGLATNGFSTNYNMQWVIMLLIVLGGMGFPIIFNLYRQITNNIQSLFGYFLWHTPKRFTPRLLNLTSKLALRTTIILLITGFVFYFLIEFKFSLREIEGMWGKFTTAMFGSVTARTAGFNTIDFSSLRLPSLLIIILLMWIGASPASTGGGIKTTTLAIASLNLASVIKGKNRPEFNRREIGTISIRRAFAVILLSLGVIGLCALGISVNDSDKGLLKIIFESFSAFSTVGLSLGITDQLSSYSKIILSITMFLGRVGTLTLMASIIRQSAPLKYKYPTEEVLI
jgi:trk system potassium uptake protein